jgi:Tfp pilus assembly protein PilX
MTTLAARKAWLLGRLREEHGFGMVLVVFATVILGVLSITLMDTMRNESTRSSDATVRQLSFQAAEAGIDDYLAKLVDDHLYYVHVVHDGESTRRWTDGTLVSGGSTWPYDLNWTYPNGKDNWKQLSNGYEYNLQVCAPAMVSPPSPCTASQYVQVIATGRRTGYTTGERTIQVMVRPSSVADFQMLADSTVSYGSAATTSGKIYSSVNICHQGIAQKDLYAEGSITCTPTLQNGAQTYDSSDIRTVIKNPVNFAALQVSLVDVKRAAQTGGLYLDNYDNVAYNAWRLIFNSGGTVTVQSCKQSGSNNTAFVQPTCGSGSPSYSNTFTVPSNGAIYATKTIIVSGQVKGRVTAASNDDVDIADNISYVTPGNDVLGLVALNSVYVADWAPDDLDWRAATIAELYQWRAWTCGSNVHGAGSTMTFTGSTVTNGSVSNPDRAGDGPTGGGCMSPAYSQRFYNYDPTLQTLPPPWFPTVEDPYSIMLFRELPGG